jgi:hypothetical protein
MVRMKIIVVSLVLSLVGCTDHPFQRFIPTGTAGLALDPKTGQECVFGRPDDVPHASEYLLGRIQKRMNVTSEQRDAGWH